MAESGTAPVTIPLVGVDVVDLSSPRLHGRTTASRFVERVFSEGERRRIDAAASPEREIWRLWAAKEAAFKVFSKLLPEPPVFHHARFEIRDAPETPVTGVTFDGTRIPVSVEIREPIVLAWSWVGRCTPTLVGHDSVEAFLAARGLSRDVDGWSRDHFGAEERDAVHGLASALVRLGARRDAAAMLGVDEKELAILCPEGHTGLRPPYLHRRGIRVEDADLSLSHDGGFIAWAVRTAG